MDFFSLLFASMFNSDDDKAAVASAAGREMRGMADLLRRWRQAPTPGAPTGRELLRLYPRLAEIYDEALARAGGDRRKVWYLPALRFESHLESRPVLLAGGAQAPAFLVREPHHLGWPNLPGAHLCGARLLMAPSLRSRPEAWVEFLEKLVENDESLAILAEEVDRDLLALLAMNAVRRTLKVCVVHPGEMGRSLEDLAEMLGRGRKQSPLLAPEAAPEAGLREQLPRVNLMARRDAAVLEPAEDESSGSGSALPTTETVWISVGGDDYHDQQNRLLAISAALACEADAVA